ncbi:hypothetical protein [Paraburkholderia tropica]|uniref:hypothetical protein n=1 Tax=Paraburkholderia tropica TaxID=92647 RepID=UPI002AB74AB3|nr:hypothetical protein [Paraburkholderia tropica]
MQRLDRDAPILDVFADEIVRAVFPDEVRIVAGQGVNAAGIGDAEKIEVRIILLVPNDLGTAIVQLQFHRAIVRYRKAADGRRQRGRREAERTEKYNQF